MSLRALAESLVRLDLAAVASDALAAQAAVIAGAVRDALSHPPGSPHDFPWRETGSLRDSIRCETDAESAVIGSRSDVALYQEHGTRIVPPRPFLAPVAVQQADATADTLGAAVAGAIRQAVARVAGNGG